MSEVKIENSQVTIKLDIVGHKCTPKCTVCGNDFIVAGKLTGDNEDFYKWYVDNNIIYRVFIGPVHHMSTQTEQCDLWENISLNPESDINIPVIEYDTGLVENDVGVSRVCLNFENDSTHQLENKKCEKCGATFAGMEKLRKHMLTHVVKNDYYKCSECNSKFKRNYDLKRHMVKHTGENMYNCTVCDMTFGKKYELQTHLLTHLQTHSKGGRCTNLVDLKDTGNNKDVTSEVEVENLDKDCTESGQAITISNPGSMLPRIRQKDYYKCSVCDSKFKRNYDLKRHMVKHTGEDMYHCEVCDMTFRKKYELISHMLTHRVDKKPELLTQKVEKKYQCTMCDSVFVELNDLKMHMLKHTGDSGHNRSSNSDNLTSYELKTDVTKETDLYEDGTGKISTLGSNDSIETEAQNYQCAHCNKRFASNSNLQRHSVTHSSIPKCDICNKTFKKQYYLKEHLVIHTGEKNYKCTVCAKAFTSKHLLKQHTIVHSKEPRYLCNVCGRGFLHKKSLHVHTLTHTGEKKYKCDVCDKAFSTISHLALHKQTHSDEKKYLCPVCGKGLKYRKNFKEHMLSHAGGNKYQCPVCNKYIKGPCNFNYHVKRHRSKGEHESTFLSSAMTRETDELTMLRLY